MPRGLGRTSCLIWGLDEGIEILWRPWWARGMCLFKNPSSDEKGDVFAAQVVHEVLRLGSWAAAEGVRVRGVVHGGRQLSIHPTAGRGGPRRVGAGHVAPGAARLAQSRAAQCPVQMLHRTSASGAQLAILISAMGNLAGQWMSELMRGENVAVFKAAMRVLNIVITGPSHPCRDQGGPEVHPYTGLAAQHLASDNGHRCWLQILELMGGEHAAISEAAKGMHNVEVTGPPSPAETEDSPSKKQESPSEQKESE